MTLHASVELIQEVLHHRLRIDDRETAVAAARWLTDLCTVHPLTEDVARQMLGLVATMNIRGRDAVPVSYTHLDVYKRQSANRGLTTTRKP